MQPVRREWVRVCGGLLWTISSGRGVALVFCHGGPGAYDYLEPVAELVDDVAECIASTSGAEDARAPAGRRRSAR